jgi:hypothetical protein
VDDVAVSVATLARGKHLTHTQRARHHLSSEKKHHPSSITTWKSRTYAYACFSAFVPHKYLCHIRCRRTPSPIAAQKGNNEKHHCTSSYDDLKQSTGGELLPALISLPFRIEDPVTGARPTMGAGKVPAVL